MSENQETRQLLDRIETLESRSRRLAGALVAVGILSAAPIGFAVGAASPDKRVEAEEFVLKDAGGKVKASLGVLENGMTALLFFDATGATAAQLAQTAEGPALGFYTASKPVATLEAFQKAPRLAFFDEAGATRAVFGAASVKNKKTGIVEKRPANGIVLYGENGQLQWEAP